MYLVSPFPNFVYALDLTKPGAPVKWQYDPKPPSATRGVACCDVVNRGAAWWNGSIIFNTLDGRAIALDAATGQERWSTPLADINKGETITMAPLVAADKLFVGTAAANSACVAGSGPSMRKMAPSPGALTAPDPMPTS